ncbi:restriction endonuclease [Nonomuraea sp. K274]|uniref:Restriction endonuclease n=1 Tax=Nonomuraea cypriaca TaxID=1187855 RepID=A0A931EVY8_9ACTN|nr:restriction endonuclease [Nonomuraea cypriaca]MBF8186154.1 restriction endonuclease [Nonomuraea cypriaca]
MARGSRRVRGKRRSRKRQEVWGWGAAGAVVVAVVVVRFVGDHPGWAMGMACLLVVMVAGGLVLRHRVIQAARQRFLAANAELEKVDQMSGTEFEHLVAERMIADGFRQVRERGGSGDGGVDITAVAAGHGRYAVHCKRYSKPVGAPDVRNFLGALANAFAGHTGILVTSSRLTKQARLEALGAREPLILVERDRLADWLLGSASLLPARSARMLTEEEAT